MAFKLRKTALLLALGLGTEGAAALAWSAYHQPWIALVLHVAASPVFALGLLASLPAPYGAPCRIGLSVLTALGFFLPGFGMLGLVIALPWAISRQRPQVELPWQEVQVPDLPYRPLFLGVTPLRAAEGALAEVLRHATNPDKRVAAVMALRHMDDRLAMPLLRIALKDPVDDVRLLAYAMLDKADQAITKRIQDRQGALAVAPERQKFFLRRYLAQDFWELAYLGLATGDVLGFVLEQSALHLLAALETREDVGARLLLGRIRLQQGQAALAEVELLSAQKGGLPDSVVMPYLAEAAFARREYDLVKARLGKLGPNFVKRPPMDAVIAFWTEAAL